MELPTIEQTNPPLDAELVQIQQAPTAPGEPVVEIAKVIPERSIIALPRM